MRTRCGPNSCTIVDRLQTGSFSLFAFKSRQGKKRNNSLPDNQLPLVGLTLTGQQCSCNTVLILRGNYGIPGNGVCCGAGCLASPSFLRLERCPYSRRRIRRFLEWPSKLLPPLSNRDGFSKLGHHRPTNPLAMRPGPLLHGDGDGVAGDTIDRNHHRDGVAGRQVRPRNEDFSRDCESARDPSELPMVRPIVRSDLPLTRQGQRLRLSVENKLKMCGSENCQRRIWHHA